MIFLDFEASGINGFPIQVGFCAVDAERTTRAAAKLIRYDEWLEDFPRWNWQAEQLHKISRSNLMELGESPAAVMAWLNGELAGMVACADSYLDQLWLRELADAAGIEPLFRVVEIQRAWEGPEIAALVDDAEADKVQPCTHRADDDAAHHAARYVLSLAPDAAVQRLMLVGAEIRRMDEYTRLCLAEDDAMIAEVLPCLGKRIQAESKALAALHQARLTEALKDKRPCE